MDFNPKERIRKMVIAIEQEAKERKEQILANAEQQFLVSKNKIENEEKEKIIDEYKRKIENYSVTKKIERSAKNNDARLSKMSARYDMITKVKEELKNQLKATINNKEMYKDLLKKLIIQGLIKLMEQEVELHCNKDDVKLVESIIGEAQDQFTQIVKKECQKDLKCKITINKARYLDSGDQKYIGGIILTCLDGRIKFINTLDARIELACQELLPQIREGLFPNYAIEILPNPKPQPVNQGEKH